MARSSQERLDTRSFIGAEQARGGCHAFAGPRYHAFESAAYFGYSLLHLLDGFANLSFEGGKVRPMARHFFGQLRQFAAAPSRKARTNTRPKAHSKRFRGVLRRLG